MAYGSIHADTLVTSTQTIDIDYLATTRDAYDIAVANGFVGTEEEWLASLIGPAGQAGPAGPAGQAGSNGSPGADGRTILSGTSAPTTQGANGDFYINTATSTLYGPKAGGVWPAGVSLVGAAGQTGPAGPAGQGVPSGGGSGQILAKNSTTDYDTHWIDAPTLTGNNTLSGANTLTIAAGSAAAPSLYPTGDSNTGIYSPGADQLAVTTGGTQRLTVDTSGNVGIGTDSPAARLDVVGTSKFSSVAIGMDPLSGVELSLTGAYAQTATAVAALAIDCSTGNYFTKTINGDSTFTVSNVPATGNTYAFTLQLTHTSGTITWFSGVIWPSGTAPTLTTGKVHLFVFVTSDGGTTWRAASQINYAS